MHAGSRVPFVLRRGGFGSIALTSLFLAAGGGSAHGAEVGRPGVALVQYRDDRGYDDRRRGYDEQRRDDDQRRRYEDDQRRRDGDDRRRGDEDQRRGDDRRGGYEAQRGGRGGSYQQSCENIRQQGSVLTAVCGAGRDRHVESSLDINRCGGGDIGNIGGYLTCGNVRGNGRRVD